MPQRINWIDYAKVIGIYLVVLGHLPIPEQGSVYIYSFHMPLFFFISGFLSKTNNITFRQFILKKIRTLIIPYHYCPIKLQN
ncbi:MAG TPA: acyltransferase family protein [Bacteroidales bacterium]|nr:acyltransferase family protein [Bacteroidales bacterium]HRS19213.1 acyltransferase family protein [Bacteroidales bacterium]